MALDKLVDSSQLNGALEATADAIRAKTGGNGSLTWDMDTGFADAVSSISTSGGGSVSGTLTITDSSNAGTNIDVSSYENVNIVGINIPAGKTFSVTVPNGQNNTITFVFTVDANGNTTVTES